MYRRDAVALWLVRQTLVQVHALSGVTASCSWARHFTLTVPFSTQVYKWVLAKYLTLDGMLCNGLASHPRESSNTPSGFMLQKLG